MKKLHIKSDYSNDYRIAWFPTMICNFKCSYCFADNGYKPFKEKKFLIFKDLINNFALEYPDRIVLQILGGEPTTIKNFNFFLEMIDRKIYIELVTNASQDLFNFSRVNYFEFSFHPEYFRDKYKERFLRNLLVPQKKLININLHNDYKNNIDFFKKSIQEIKNFCINKNIDIKFNINPLSIYYDDRDNLDIEWFVKELNITENDLEEENFYYLNGKKISLIEHLEIYRQFNNNFKNCWCKMNNFVLDYDYNIFYSCSGGNDYSKSNLLKEKKFPKIKFFKCKLNRCDPSCYLDCEKIIKAKK